MEEGVTVTVVQNVMMPELFLELYRSVGWDGAGMFKMVRK